MHSAHAAGSPSRSAGFLFHIFSFLQRSSRLLSVTGNLFLPDQPSLSPPLSEARGADKTGEPNNEIRKQVDRAAAATSSCSCLSTLSFKVWQVSFFSSFLFFRCFYLGSFPSTLESVWASSRWLWSDLAMGVNGCPLAFFCTRGGPEDPESSQGLPNSNRCQFHQTPRLCGRHLDGYRGQLENNSEAVLALTGKEKAERQQQKTFSPDKLKCLTAAGPNTEVRNKINKGGSWHQWSPLARVCCFDDRQGELMRYDVARCTASPCCTVMMVTMRFLCSPGRTCVVSHQRCNRQHYARVFMRKLPTSVPMMFINPRFFFLPWPALWGCYCARVCVPRVQGSCGVLLHLVVWL